MGIKAEVLEQRAINANFALKGAIRDFLVGQDLNLAEAQRKRKSFLLEFEYSEQSLPSIPIAIRRLVKSAYTDNFPIWAVRLGLAYDPASRNRVDGEKYTSTLDVVVHGHTKPSPIELEEKKIAVGKLECYLGHVIVTEPDVRPLNYMVEKTPMLLSSRNRQPTGTHRIGEFGPAVIEAAVKILTSYPRTGPEAEDERLLREASAGRAQRAAGAIRRFIYPKVGIATQTPSVRVEIFTPAH